MSDDLPSLLAWVLHVDLTYLQWNVASWHERDELHRRGCRVPDLQDSAQISVDGDLTLSIIEQLGPGVPKIVFL